MFIHNYDLIRADRSRTGGGVCLYIRNTINYFERKYLNRDNLEAVCIEVNKPSSASFIVGTIYRPPGASVDSFANIEQLIKLIDDENKEFYMLGDLNANMFDVSNNATKNLNSIIELYQLTQTISSPTRVTMTTSYLFIYLALPTRAGSPQQHMPITVGPFYLTHPVNFPCGRKPEYPGKTHDFRQSVDFYSFHMRTGFESH